MCRNGKDTARCIPEDLTPEGTFWAYYMDVYSVLGEESGPKLMYWSKAARKNKFENPEAASSDGWSYITIPFQDGGTAFGQCLALKHEKNKNKDCHIYRDWRLAHYNP